MDLNLEALAGELGAITPPTAAAPDDPTGPDGPVAHGEFGALVAALILLPEASPALAPHVWPGFSGLHVLDTAPKALPATVDIAPDTVTVPGPGTMMVPGSGTAILAEPKAMPVLPSGAGVVPESGPTVDVEPAPWVPGVPGVDEVPDAVQSARVDVPAPVPAGPEEHEEPSPRLDLSASDDVMAVPPAAEPPAMGTGTRETGPVVAVAPTGAPRGILSPAVEPGGVESREVKAPRVKPPQLGSPRGGSHAVDSPNVESRAVRSLDAPPAAPRAEAPRTPGTDMIPIQRVSVTAVSDRPAALPDMAVLKPAVRSDVAAGAPDVALDRLMDSIGMRPAPVAAPVAPDAGIPRDKIPAAAAAAGPGVAGTPWQTAMAGAPVAATPNLLLRPAADDGQPLESRLVELVRWQAREGGGQVEIKLRPEFLGAMTVTVHVDGGVVKASLAAESQATRDFLQAEAGHLKSALEDQGFTLETFEVSDEANPREQEHPHQRPRQQPAPRRSARSLSAGTSFGEAFDVVM